jgi:tRNA G18 (ribose-2'-O)-methylase SpoU
LPDADWEADYQHVGDHRWLTTQGLFVAEGRFVVRRLLESRRFRIKSIIVTPAALLGLSDALLAGTPVHVLEQDVLNRITGFNFHRGCLALAHRPAATAPAGLLDKARRLLALEGVGNPDNVGGLFRVAAAFGVDGFLLDPASADPFYRKAIRTSMGAVLDVPFERVHAWPAALGRFRERGFDVVALTPREDARPLAEYVAAGAPARRIVIVVGAEGSGLTEEALAEATERVRIPISPGVDSLNVTVAAGIALASLAV